MALARVDAQQIVEEDRNGTDNLECAMCFFIIRWPVKMENCTHVFCKECIDMWAEEQREKRYQRIAVGNARVDDDLDGFTCPSCRSRSEYTRPCEETMERINRLRFDCENRGLGCNHLSGIGGLKLHQKHCNYSPYRYIVCNDCRAQLRGNAIDQHNCIRDLRRYNRRLRLQNRELMDRLRQYESESE